MYVMAIEYEFHPVASLFPMLAEPGYREFKADIQKRGLLEPIWLYENKILDGRNRYRACTETGIRPEFVDYDGDDPVGFVISLNLHRRHLDAGQRAMVATEVEAVLSKEAKKRQMVGANQYQSLPEKLPEGSKGESRDQAGKLMGVSGRYVSDAKRIKEHDPELAERVLSGQTTLQKARREVARETQTVMEPPPLPDDKFNLIYADPPWRYEHSRTDSREIENHYPTMSLDEICSLPVPDLAAPDCTLFLWTTSPKLHESMTVLGAWGFNYRTCAVWDKEIIGMGYYFRQQHELLLVATKGRPPAPDPANRVSSIIRSRRERHSKKPEQVIELLESMYPKSTRIELFARQIREGWSAWGNDSCLTD